MKIFSIVMRILFGLVLLMPVLGMFGVFPPPTPDLFTPQGWAFMEAMMNTGYMMPLLGITCLAGVILLILGRTALAAIIIAPFTVNVLFFHVMENNLFAAPSIPAWVLAIANAYFLWEQRAKYRQLW